MSVRAFSADVADDPQVTDTSAAGKGSTLCQRSAAVHADVSNPGDVAQDVADDVTRAQSGGEDAAQLLTCKLGAWSVRVEERRARRSAAELAAFVFSAVREPGVQRALGVVSAGRQAFVRSFAVGLAGGSVLAVLMRVIMEVFLRTI